MDDMLTVPQVSKLLNCSQETVRRLLDQIIEEGYEVQRIRPTSPRKIRRSELQRYADAQRLQLDWSKLDK